MLYISTSPILLLSAVKFARYSDVQTTHSERQSLAKFCKATVCSSTSSARDTAHRQHCHCGPRPKAATALLQLLHYAVDALRYAMRSLRSVSFFKPAKIIFVPC